MIATAVNLLLLFLLLACKEAPLKPGEVEWVAINICTRDIQGDAHLLRFSGGQNYLIDAGDQNHQLIPYLKSRDIHQLDKVFITHAHKDHYGGLRSLAAAQIEMKQIYFNKPDRPTCDAEIPWGCNWQEVESIFNQFQPQPLLSGVAYENENTRLEVLHVYNQTTSPVGKIDINDMSAIMRLNTGPIAVLFTGDLNNRIGTYLANQKNPALKAQLLKMPHHGGESLAPDSFFDWVAPEWVIIPTAAKLWKDQRTERVRNWISRNKKMKWAVTGVDGHLRFLLSPTGYKRID